MRVREAFSKWCCLHSINIPKVSHLPASNLAPASMQTFGCSFFFLSYLIIHFFFSSWHRPAPSLCACRTSESLSVGVPPPPLHFLYSAAYAAPVHSSLYMLALRLQPPAKPPRPSGPLKANCSTLQKRKRQISKDFEPKPGNPFVTPQRACLPTTVYFFELERSSGSIICTSRAGRRHQTRFGLLSSRGGRATAADLLSLALPSPPSLPSLSP